MTLEQALDFLAKNCPTVFQPISLELVRLNRKDEVVEKDLEKTQKALNELIFNTLNGGM